VALSHCRVRFSSVTSGAQSPTILKRGGWMSALRSHFVSQFRRTTHEANARVCVRPCPAALLMRSGSASGFSAQRGGLQSRDQCLALPPRSAMASAAISRACRRHAREAGRSTERIMCPRIVSSQHRRLRRGEACARRQSQQLGGMLLESFRRRIPSPRRPLPVLALPCAASREGAVG